VARQTSHPRQKTIAKSEITPAEGTHPTFVHWSFGTSDIQAFIDLPNRNTFPSHTPTNGRKIQV
jgi:hypothetical protein